MSDSSSNKLAKDIIGTIEDDGLDLSKCRVQVYNSATNMSDVYTGVQSRIAAKELMAVYVKCTSHNLILTHNDSMKIHKVRTGRVRVKSST